MTALTERDRALAMQVALRLDDWTAAQGCPAWIDSADRQCGRPPAEGYLCRRHHTVAVRRLEKDQARRQAAAEKRAAHRAANLPAWRAELARVEAEIERRDRPVVADRAAVGGVVHPSIRKRQLAALSDTNVKRMAELYRRHDELTRKIGAAS